MADDILKNIPLPADLPENWTSQQTVAPTGAEVGLDEQHGYNYLMKQVNNAQKAATALNEGKLGLHDTAVNGVVASGSNYVRFGDGTQICWGETGQIAVNANSTVTATITYPAAFASGYPMEVSLTIAGNSENDNYSKLVLHTTERRTTNCDIYFKNTSSSQMSPIAQWIAIGHWK
nr:MAG TPA: putative tail fiber protein [Caudoviricetes sp.]